MNNGGNYRDDGSFLFELRVSVAGKRLTVRAFESSKQQYISPHTRLDLEARYDGKVLFPLGALYIGVPSHHSIDSDAAKRSALGCFALKPGDTDADFFEDYTREQLAWVSAHGEELSLIVYDRFGED